jgi:hypothetical protein
MSFFRSVLPALAWVVAACALPVAQAHAQQRAHVHGQLKLEIAIEGPTVTIAMEAPLDSLLGFERAPRNDVEKKAVETMTARLRAADGLFKIDPAANCKLGPVDLRSFVLGLGKAEAPARKSDEHADLDANFGFNCSNAAQAKFIEVGLFEAFQGTRQIEVQIVTADGQFKRTLRRPATRLAWGK